jgi:choline dehydrogenase-like flavoprotein
LLLLLKYLGGWTRGEKENYDEWAKLVGDRRWSYDGLLPYFRKIETYFDPDGDRIAHGFDGPIKMEAAATRQYPLREQVKAAWAAVGVAYKPDMNDGNPIGLGQLVENRADGVRQIASSAYPLDVVRTNTMVKRVVIEAQDDRQVAVAVELVADGNHHGSSIITARREVIICAGTYRSPQVLMLSGVGPRDELQKHGIDLIVDLPDVGRHFEDHAGVSQWWKLKNPERGLSTGSSAYNSNPIFFKGNPVDFVATLSVPRDGLLESLAVGNPNADPKLHPLAFQHGHLESYLVYLAWNPENPTIVPDGSHITSSVVCMLPTSRGSIRLADADPRSAPLVDPNYLATEADRYMLRQGLRKLYHVLRETDAGKAFIDSETTEHDAQPVSPESSDVELDALICRRLQCVFPLN